MASKRKPVCGVLCSKLSTWLKYKDDLRKAHGNCGPAWKRLRTAKHSDVEAALLMSFKDARAIHVIKQGYFHQLSLMRL